MKFSVEWLEDAPNRALEERATAAEFRLWLGNVNATVHFWTDQSFDFIEIPVYPIAEGIALDWWKLFGSRNEEISVKRYRSGYALPDIRMSFDGSTFEARTDQTTYTNPDVRFWNAPTEILSRTESENGLSGFIEKVIDRLNEQGATDTTLALRWARICTSMADPDEKAFCEAAAALGEDPYEVSDAAVETIERSAEIFKEEALTEFLAGARGKDGDKLLAWIDRVRNLPKDTSRLTELRGIAHEAAEATPPVKNERAWAHGYRRARACRRALGLQDADRFRTYKELAKKFGNASYDANHHVDGIRVLREDDEKGVILYLRGQKFKAAKMEQLFNLARGIGDAVCFPEHDIAPINDVDHAFRQRCGRAFAAEFLAPITEVKSMKADGRDPQTIAEEFGVSELVIKHQIDNGDRIEKACLAR